MVRVRSIRVTPSTEAEEQESAATRVASPDLPRASSDRPRGDTRRATRLHPNPGSGRTRDQPLHLQPARAAPRRDARDAMGCTTDPSRRATTAAHRTTAARPKGGPPGDHRAGPRPSHPKSSTGSAPNAQPAKASPKSRATSTPPKHPQPTAGPSGGHPPCAPSSLAHTPDISRVRATAPMEYWRIAEVAASCRHPFTSDVSGR